MSVIQTMLDRLFGKGQHRVLMLGFDSPGRTTALYRMKLGESVTTMPTIGINVETVEYKRTDFTFWDMGGRDKIRPLWRHYYQGTDAIIFVVNSEPKWFSEYEEMYRDELAKLLVEDELRDAVLMVWANKQDLPGALPAAEVASRLALHQLRIQWQIFGTTAITGDGLHESLDWLRETLTGRKLSTTPGAIVHKGIEGIAATLSAPATTTLSKTKKGVPTLSSNKLLRWLESDDEDDEELLKTFQHGTVAWDHCCRLHVAWASLKKHSRRDAMQLVFAGVKRIVGEDFHETTVYFWMHMVHYAITATANPSGDFKGFLLLNPQLADSNLILSYYSQHALWQDPEAKTSVVLPDAKQLPSLVSKVDGHKDVGHAGAAKKSLSDEEFHERLLVRTLPSWGHDVMLRAIWVCLRKEGRRKGGTGKIFEALKQVEGSCHNVTATYFWLQMVSFCDATGDVETFADFAKSSKNSGIFTPKLISEHYSDTVLGAGAASFALPDLKPLPSVVH